jgi:hypothetical protein
MALHARVLWLAPHDHFVALDLECCAKARREVTQPVHFRLLCSDGAGDCFIPGVVTDKGEGSAHDCPILCGSPGRHN